MFGYVTVYKPELKIKEFEAYKGVYCTLCKEMGKEYGFFSRFLLSYDGAFFVMYKMALTQNKICAKQSRCSFNPAKKCMKITCDSDVYKLASTITVILAYFKLVDNLHDSSFIKKILLFLIYPYFIFLKNKAKKNNPEIFSIVQDGMTAQFNVEKNVNSSIDISAHNTAHILGQLFSYNEEDKENAYKFGYQLGRVVYFLDAFDDYSDDLKNSSFNPFKKCENLVEEASQTINMSIGELVSILKQQNLYDFKPIIENVIYDGLNFQLKKIENKHGGVKSE